MLQGSGVLLSFIVILGVIVHSDAHDNNDNVKKKKGSRALEPCCLSPFYSVDVQPTGSARSVSPSVGMS